MEGTISTTFRTAQPVEVTTEVQKPIVNETHNKIEDNVEVPYTDFENVYKKPFTVDYYNLGDLWDDPQGGFTEEINVIEAYLKHKIMNADIADSIIAIKNELKDLEKTNNMTKEERLTVKLGTIAAYTKFLMERDGIKFKVKKYGH